MPVDLFVGGLSGTIQGESISRLQEVTSNIIDTCAYRPKGQGLHNLDLTKCRLFYDSGAFQRVKAEDRISDAEVLELQLSRERELSELVGYQVQSYALASNDWIVDKQKKDVDQGWQAVKATIKSAEYLASQRRYLGDRVLVLGCQGVNASQYKTCVSEVLSFSDEQDWIGIGGWASLGKNQGWMPEFRKTLREVIPLISKSSVKHIHIYGVMFEPALGNLLWMCDRYGLTCSTDSTKALSDCRYKDEERRNQAGARHHYWMDNVRYWKNHLEHLDKTAFYRSPLTGSTTQHAFKRGNNQLVLGLI